MSVQLRAMHSFKSGRTRANVLNCVKCAPQIPALLDAIEEELAEEESKLSWATAPAAPTAKGSSGGAHKSVVPGTPPPQQRQTAAAPAAASPFAAAFMSPEPGQKRQMPPTPARTPARQLHAEWR